MELRFDYLMEALPILGKGMLGIFLITSMIIGVVALLNRLTSEKDIPE